MGSANSTTLLLEELERSLDCHHGQWAGNPLAALARQARSVMVLVGILFFQADSLLAMASRHSLWPSSSYFMNSIKAISLDATSTPAVLFLGRSRPPLSFKTHDSSM